MRPCPAPEPGSSPLARGLPLTQAFNMPASRIIPARAGFTSAGRPGRRRTADHPRSRGVYTSVRPWPAGTSGSSPLARGLPPHRRGVHRPAGIIPARAGFTRPHPQALDDRLDHPRSRGVYTCPHPHAAPPPGSSPLARGLPREIAGAVGVLGIIPARAGFTSPSTPPTQWAQDHPRSRGVYPVGRAVYRPVIGSSPLARGLRSWCASPQ